MPAPTASAPRWLRSCCPLPQLEVVTLRDGPPAITTWRDWHAVAEPLCRQVETDAADAYIIACVSDPAIDLLRSVNAAAGVRRVARRHRQRGGPH